MQNMLMVVLGVAFGVVFERYQLCLNSAMGDPFIVGDTSRLRGLVAAVLASGVLFNLLIGLQVVPAAATALYPTTIGAGIAFGIGMNLAGGCVSGTLFKMTEGHVASWIAAAGITLGLLTSGSMMSLVALPGGGMKPLLRGTLPQWLGVHPLVVAAALAAAVVAIVWISAARRRGSGGSRQTGAAAHSRRPRAVSSFVVGGVLVALLNTAFFWTASMPFGLGGLMAYMASGLAVLGNPAWARTHPMFGHLMAHPEYAVMGVLFLAGAFGSAVVGKRVHCRMPNRRQAISSLVGGYLMGLATALMVGCNVTHLLGGLPQLGFGGLGATLGIVIGAWLGTRLVATIVTHGHVVRGAVASTNPSERVHELTRADT